MTLAQRTAILDKLALGRNPHTISRALEVPVSYVRVIMNEGLEDLPGWGRLSLQRNLLSRRLIGRSWPKDDTLLLAEHRRLHDMGRVSMCQGRDGDWILQYAVPLKNVVKRAVYFGSNTEC